MSIPQLMPWIRGAVTFEAGLSPLVCVRYAMEELSQWKFTGMRLNPQ